MIKQGGSSSHARVGVSMRGCEGSGQPGGPGVRGHAHQTACGEWLSSSAQRACQSRLIMRSGWIFPSTPGWSHPPRPSLHPPLKKRAFAWQSGVDFMKKERKERENEIKNPFGVPQSPPYIPKGWTLGIKERFGKVTPIRPLIYRVPPTTFIQYITWMHSAFKCQKKSQHCFLIITTAFVDFQKQNEEDPTVSAEGAITSAAGVNFN